MDYCMKKLKKSEVFKDFSMHLKEKFLVFENFPQSKSEDTALLYHQPLNVDRQEKAY